MCVYNVGLSLQPGTGAGTALGLGAAAWDSALVLAAYIASLPAEALQGGCSCIKDSLLAKSRRLPSKPGSLLADPCALSCVSCGQLQLTGESLGRRECAHSTQPAARAIGSTARQLRSGLRSWALQAGAVWSWGPASASRG